MTEQSPIVDYIESQPESTKEKLYELYRAIKEVIPDATEKISWNMPTFTGKKDIVHFAAHKHHIGLYPAPEAVTVFADKLSDYAHSKGAFQFPYGKPLPIAVVKEIVEYNLAADSQRGA